MQSRSSPWVHEAESGPSMVHCPKCGTQVNEGTAFCPQCGTAIAASAPPQYPPAPPPQYPPAAPPATTAGMPENVAAMLSYVLGWLTGIIFLLVDKRPYVRFHAAQSIVVFGILHIIRLVLVYAFFGAGYATLGFTFGIHALILGFVGLVTFVAWIVLMIMAYQGKRFEVPGAGQLARSLAGKV